MLDNHREPAIDCERLRKDEVYRREVFEMLLINYQHAIYRYCTKVFRSDETLGRDIAQDVFVAVLGALPRFKGDAPIEKWLFGIARNRCRKTLYNLRRRRDIIKQYSEDIRYHLHRSENDKSQEQSIKLADAVASLGEKDRLLFNLYYIKRLPIEEIAGLAGNSKNAIQQRLYRIRKHLQEVVRYGSE